MKLALSARRFYREEREAGKKEREADRSCKCCVYGKRWCPIIIAAPPDRDGFLVEGVNDFADYLNSFQIDANDSWNRPVKTLS